MRTPARLLLPGLALGALLLGLPACDFSAEDIGIVANVTDLPVQMGPNDGAVSVTAGQTTTSSSTVSSDVDVAEITELQQIELKREFFSFVETAAAGKVQDSGTITLLVLIGEPGEPLVPVPGTPVVVTIQDNAVTQVTPSAITFNGATYDRNAINAVLGSLPSELVPAVQEMTVAQAVEALEAILALRTGFVFQLIAQSDGVSGNLKLNQFTIDARVRES